MPIDRPYHRIWRPHSGQKNSLYVQHQKYAMSPDHNVRAFLLIQKDLRDLFDHVEPADENLICFSFRIHALLLRTCVEVESNCKAILSENGYNKQGRWNMQDYKKIEYTHLLSHYRARFPTWNGQQAIRNPFEAWATGKSLPWYEAYNAVKHDRHFAFKQANFGNLIDAICGLYILLSSQFETHDFSNTPSYLCINTPFGMRLGIGDFIYFGPPKYWPAEMHYDFDWDQIKHEENPFQLYNYNLY